MRTCLPPVLIKRKKNLGNRFRRLERTLERNPSRSNVELRFPRLHRNNDHPENRLHGIPARPTPKPNVGRVPNRDLHQKTKKGGILPSRQLRKRKSRKPQRKQLASLSQSRPRQPNRLPLRIKQPAHRRQASTNRRGPRYRKKNRLPMNQKLPTKSMSPLLNLSFLRSNIYFHPSLR